MIDVCQAILDMKRDSFDDGRNQGTDNAKVEDIMRRNNDRFSAAMEMGEGIA